MNDLTKVQYNREELQRAIRKSEDLNHDEKTSTSKWIESFEDIGPNFNEAYAEAIADIYKRGK